MVACSPEALDLPRTRNLFEDKDDQYAYLANQGAPSCALPVHGGGWMQRQVHTDQSDHPPDDHPTADDGAASNTGAASYGSGHLLREPARR